MKIHEFPIKKSDCFLEETIYGFKKLVVVCSLVVQK